MTDVILAPLVERHADEAAFLWCQRQSAIGARARGLSALDAIDTRLESHIDGLRIAGELGAPAADRLASDGAGTMFLSALLALESRNVARLGELIVRAEGDSAPQAEIISALEWVSAQALRGTVKEWLGSVDREHRRLGLAACVAHRVDPGDALRGILDDPAPGLGLAALRAAGQLGRLDMLRACVEACVKDDLVCRAAAAASAVLLGDRQSGLCVLSQASLDATLESEDLLALALAASSPAAAHRVLQDVAAHTERSRWLVNGSGIAGDPAYVSWLIGQMSNPQLARLAGEAFTLITGVDLAAQQMGAPQPEGFESGPSDDPNDENVDMDPDDGLPWPDVKKVEQWWAKNGGRFTKGQRYFLGEPVSRAHCIHVLKHGYQRQRILAAHYLCLLEPGTPLFNTSAPAWRQQRLLATMA